MVRTKYLEKIIPDLLDKAVDLIPQKGRDIKLYIRDISYRCNSYRIEKAWKGKHPKGYLVTKHKDLTREDFLKWILSQPSKIQLEVYNNLLNYINTETPKERGEVEFRSYLDEA